MKGGTPLAGIVDKVAWVHVQDGKVLCARSKGKESYYLSGGKREPGETDQETLVREIAEELSVQLRPESIAYFCTFEAQAHGKAEGVVVKMTGYTASSPLWHWTCHPIAPINIGA